MKTFGIVEVPNCTVTMFADWEDYANIAETCTREDGTIDIARAHRVEQARHKRRLAAQGAVGAHFFPVKKRFA